MMIKIYYLSALMLLLLSCTPTPVDVQKSSELPPIYPDYCDVTIPENTAPKNCRLLAERVAIQRKEG